MIWVPDWVELVPSPPKGVQFPAFQPLHLLPISLIWSNIYRPAQVSFPLPDCQTPQCGNQAPRWLPCMLVFPVLKLVFSCLTELYVCLKGNLAATLVPRKTVDPLPLVLIYCPPSNVSVTSRTNHLPSTVQPSPSLQVNQTLPIQTIVTRSDWPTFTRSMNSPGWHSFPYHKRVAFNPFSEPHLPINSILNITQSILDPALRVYYKTNITTGIESGHPFALLSFCTVPPNWKQKCPLLDVWWLGKSSWVHPAFHPKKAGIVFSLCTILNWMEFELLPIGSC